MSKMDIYTYSLLAALGVLWPYAIFSTVRTSFRKKQSLFGGSARLRGAIVGVLILAACFLIFLNVDSLRTGVLMVAASRKFTHSTGPFFKVYRAEEPHGFWIFFVIYSYLELTFLYVAGGEIVCSFREKKAVNHAAAKRQRHTR
jgi:hypothetical protein